MNDEYDLIVIGGGSAGLPLAKEAKRLGAKVLLFDFVKPTLHGTTWGFGGVCQMSGCIIKKLLHYTARLGHQMSDAVALGWILSTPPQAPRKPVFNWTVAIDRIHKYVNRLSYFGRANVQSTLEIDYVNAYATFVDSHTLQYKTQDGGLKTVQGKSIVIATGSRPKFPTEAECKGALTLGISSDDLFWRKQPPGRILIIGAAYIALECAGFLNDMGFDVTVAVRSILLKGFDQQCANMVGELMECNGVRFLRPVIVTALEKSPQNLILVTLQSTKEDKKTWKETYNTVMFAIGRESPLLDMQLEKAGVQLQGDKIKVDAMDQTTSSNIYAIGDCAGDRPELTPVAYRAGVLLAQGLFASGKETMDYDLVPTTVFTPTEYGCIGLSEEAAIEALGLDNVDIFLWRFAPLEVSALPHEPTRKARSFEFHERRPNSEEEAIGKPALAKLIIDKRNDHVVGFHVLAPDAGDITQGFAVLVKNGMTKKQLDSVLGIHPTVAESFIRMNVTRSSAVSFLSEGGCGGGACS